MEMHMLATNGIGECALAAQGQHGQSAVWRHVIEALVGIERDVSRGDPQAESQSQTRAESGHVYAPSPHVEVSVIERLTDTSVSVRWRDATRGHYDDQIWISCRARSNGRCALSGAPIRRHDFVYKPRARSIVPANANAMILASLIARVTALT
jgi:hypothetical protein